MPRPKSGYLNKAGQSVPGATTVCGRFKDSGALIYWAWDCGKKGLDIRSEKDVAADAGTCAHTIVYEHLHGRVVSRSDYSDVVWDKAMHAFEAFLEWEKAFKVKVVSSEESRVSERHQFGGCWDFVFDVNGELRIVDLKTSNGIYSDMLIQVAGAYSLLWEEHHPDQPLHGMDLLRISKPKALDDPVSFEHRHFSAEVFKPCQRMFLLLREAYDLDKKLKGFV